MEDRLPRTDAANQDRRDAQHAKILASATSVFARNGLAATMADVAAAAGISQGLAYRYFASKDELVRAIVAEAMRAAPGADPQLDLDATPGQRLDVLVSRIVEARRAHPEFFQLINHVASDPETPADLLVQMMDRGRTFARMLRQMIVEAQATGEAAGDDPDELVTAVIACLDGLARLSRNHPEQSRAAFPGPQIILRLLKPPAQRKEDA
jgi:AcrR family transcriptional regulator